MFVTKAFAQDAAAGSSAMGSGLEMLFLFAPLLVGWYFLLIRPQRRQMKKRAATLSSVRRGDQVVLSSGVVGKVTKVVDDKEIELEIAEGVRVRAVLILNAEGR